MCSWLASADGADDLYEHKNKVPHQEYAHQLNQDSQDDDGHEVASIGGAAREYANEKGKEVLEGTNPRDGRAGALKSESVVGLN